MQVPPFCPNPDCAYHRPDTIPRNAVFWIRVGSYSTKVSGIVQRFLCSICGKGFSERSCSIDYYTKKILDYHEIHRATISSESLTSIARNLGCSVASIQNRQDRLGRNCLAMQARLLADHELIEDLCADGFESFDRSKFFPNAINILVGTDSQFLYGDSHATLRRKGRMTSKQKRKQAEYDVTFSPCRGNLTRSFSRLVEEIEPLWKRSAHPQLVLRTDEHPVYPRAIAKVSTLRTALSDHSFIHETYSSKIPRTPMNPLFSVNYYDRELRKDIAAFRRESTCFTRNVANGLLRFSHHMVWHNYFKPHRIVSTAMKPESHAVVAGIDATCIDREKERLYSERSFLSHQRLSDEQRKTWLKRHSTPLKDKKDYCPRYALAGYLQASEN
jgi:hypothetical protein